MKVLIRTSAVFMLVIFGLSLSVNAQARKKADKDTEQWNYEIECVGTGVYGTYLIKVWSYSKKEKVAIEQAKKNAVHGVIFKGFAAGAKGCTSQKPLARNPNIEFEQKEFFDEFFEDGGKYMKYVSLSSDGMIGAGDRLKIGKKKYKIGVVVSVQKDALRKDLEAAGIIKGLSSGF